MSNVRQLNGMKEDFSRPYESWATSRLPSAKSPWNRPTLLVGLGVTLAAAGLNAWVLVTGVLQPLWNRPSTLSFLVVLVPLLSSLALMYLAPLFRGWKTGAMSAALLLLLPFVALLISPLFLFFNQAADFHSPQCSSHAVVGKEVLKRKRGSSSYEIVLRAQDGQMRTIGIPQAQFSSLHQGQNLWINVGQGLLGIQYVAQLSPDKVPSCSH